MSGKMIALESSEASSHCLQSISPTDPESHRGNWGDLGPKLQDLRQQNPRACVYAVGVTPWRGSTAVLRAQSRQYLERFGPAARPPKVWGEGAGRCQAISIDPS